MGHFVPGRSWKKPGPKSPGGLNFCLCGFRFQFEFFFNFDFQMHLKRFVFEILFIGDYSLSFYL